MPHHIQDTIAAIATAPGPAALSIVRISGPDSTAVADRVFSGKVRPSDMASHSLHYGHILDRFGRMLDEAVLAVFKAPRSYTAQDMAEITCHGGAAAAPLVLEAVLEAGARLAGPGEFSLRAYLNGRLDLAQAEAVADIIAARTGSAARAALERLSGGLSREIAAIREALLSAAALVESMIDFPEEDLPPVEAGRLMEQIALAGERVQKLIQNSRAAMALRDGARVVIAGKPNVGKSSLFNLLLREEKAIVTETPGTTRDVLEGWIEMGGLPVRLFDTAGLRETGDPVEAQGMARARGKLEQADLVLLVLDGAALLSDQDRDLLDETSEMNRLVLVNKCDLAGPGQAEEGWIEISALTEQGLPRLEQAMIDRLRGGANPESGLAAANARQLEALRSCRHRLHAAGEGLTAKLSPELVAEDLRAAIDSLGLITGQTIGDEILHRIFAQFCIGK